MILANKFDAENTTYCPFCGSKDLFLKDLTAGTCVVCNACFAQGSPQLTNQGATDVWNRRKETRVQTEIKEKVDYLYSLIQEKDPPILTKLEVLTNFFKGESK